MTRTVVALYDDFDHANQAVRDLADRGFDRDQISLMANDTTGEYRRNIGVQTESPAAEGAGVGAGIGAVLGGLGGLLVGLGALTIPGIGPVIAAGPLAAALSGLAGAGAGAVAGGVTGGIIGGLTDLGVPEENAQYYAEGIRRGGTLVSVRVPDDRTNDAVEILNLHNPVDINQRLSSWRSEGWTRFDPDAQPYHSERLHERSHEVSGRIGETMSEPAGAETAFMDFTDYETRFRNHYDTSMSASGFTYEQYLPAYRYGYDLAVNERYHDYDDWGVLEPEARRYWDERNPGTWDRFKMAVEHAWNEVKQSVS